MAARRPVSPPSAAEATALRVRAVGADGDGLAALPDGTPVYVPDTLPGELVLARPTRRRGEGLAAVAEAIVEASPERVSPPCPHFGPCGGCALQHWRDDGYAAFKSGLVADALRRAGFDDARLAPLARTPPGGRRRMDYALRRVGGRVLVGLHARRSREVVDVHACPITDPRLFAVVPALRRALPGLAALRREGSAVLNLLDSGPDLLLRTDGALTAADRALLAAFARAHGLPRISWARGDDPPEPACLLRPPATDLAGVAVQPPPGGFLQASREGEAAIRDAVLAGLPERLPGRARIVELFAGCGTLTFPLARRAHVRAFEGDAAALASLRGAAAGVRIEPVGRDLARQPLGAKELVGAAVVVLDPPFAGAAAQMPAIAEARPPRVVYVSCNPAALARDAAALRVAGYGLVGAAPIDQFLWSARVESVAVFAR